MDSTGPLRMIRSPAGPYSAAAFLVRPTTPCFAAVYAPLPGAATAPWIDAMGLDRVIHDTFRVLGVGDVPLNGARRASVGPDLGRNPVCRPPVHDAGHSLNSLG
jgi:hypothetical protein